MTSVSTLTTPVKSVVVGSEAKLSKPLWHQQEEKEAQSARDQPRVNLPKAVHQEKSRSSKEVV